MVIIVLAPVLEEEEDTNFVGYGAAYFDKWFSTFRTTASELINKSFNSLPLGTKTPRHFSTQQTAHSEKFRIPEDLNLQVVTNWSGR